MTQSPAPGEAMRVTVEVADGDHAAAVAVLPALADAQASAPTRGFADDLGPVVQYVLPGSYAITLLARSALDLVRRSGRGRVLDLSGENVTITYGQGIPRGVLIVRKDGVTVGVYDLAREADSLSDIIDKLKGG